MSTVLFFSFIGWGIYFSVSSACTEMQSYMYAPLLDFRYSAESEHRKQLLNSILKGTVSGEVRWVLLLDKSIESSFQWLMLPIIKF